MSGESTLRIRPMRPEDVVALEALGHRAPGLASHRLAEQARGQSVVFLAFVDEELVGHAVLTWEGAGSPPLPSPIEDCPNVSDVWVQPKWRRRGIGLSLLEACESVSRDQGFRRIGLSVGVDNTGAAALYRNHGYVDAGLPEYRESGRWTDANGKLVEWNEMCRYLIKVLSAPGDPPGR